MSSNYIMESADEAYRLEFKTKREETLKHLEIAGLKKGMNVLDVGCGTGAITRIIAEIVNPGRVIGIDFSAERLEIAKGLAHEAGIENVEFIQCDILQERDFSNWPKNFFNLVWSRFLFEYLKKPEEVLRKLKELVAPGGKVVVADLDGHQGAYFYPIEKEIEQTISKVFRRLPKEGFDPFVGRKLYNMFYKAGFKDIKVHILPYQVVVGRVSPDVLKNWQIKLETLKPLFMRILKDESVVKQTSSEFLNYLEREDTFSFSLLFIVEGRRG